MATLAEKIIESHLVEGSLEREEEIAIRIDQTLTQDATGTLAYLQFEALGIPKVKTKLSVSYIDHNTLQTGFENADDHLYLQSVASKYGIIFSRPGNGICHQVHLERFGIPGQTLLGSDSHTSTCGGLGMIAIGAGGLDVATAMGGNPFYLMMPKILGIELKGKLRPWVSAKDVILEILRRLTVKGGIGKILEYHGNGLKALSVPERATIANMGTELGATTSIFPSDEVTKKFLKSQNRERDFKKLGADKNASYDEVLEIDLSELEPVIALPGSPDGVVKVREVEGRKVSQVIIGSCTNSSYRDLMVVAKALKGNSIHKDVSFSINPGSKQVLENISKENALKAIISSGARVSEPSCLGCIGMGQAPATNTISIRTFNRNFPGRSGTKNDQVYLCSPETAIATAINGKITDPRKLGKYPNVKLPVKFIVNDNMIILPAKNLEKVEIIKGPNIKPLPTGNPLQGDLNGEVLLKVGDNITTDHIMPAGSKILPLRSNIPAISEYVFEQIDPEFSKRAKEKNGGFIVGGENYGQGSSREHAALAPMYLGIRAIIAKSFARIHKANLINFGILPLEFENPSDYENISQGDVLEINEIKKSLKNREKEITIYNKKKSTEFNAKSDLTERHRNILIAGGLLNYIRSRYS